MEPSRVQKIRALPWALAGDAANMVYVTIAFAGPVFLLFLDKIDLDKTQIGLVLSIIPFCNFFALATARLTARIGFKRTFLAVFGLRKFVLALIIATPWVHAQAGNRGAFLFVASVILVFAICRSVSISAIQVWVQEFVPGDVRGRYSAFQNVIWVVAGAATLAVTGQYLGEDPTFGKFQVAFTLAFGFGIASIWFYWRVPGGAPATDETRARTDLASIGATLRDRQFVLFLAAGGLIVLGWLPLSMGGFLPLFLKEKVGFKPDQVLFFNSVLLGSGVVSCFLWGWAADRYGSKPILILTNAVLCLFPLALWMMPRHDVLSYRFALVLAVVAGLAMPGRAVAYSRLLFVKLIPADRRPSFTVVHLGWIGLVSGLAPLVAGRLLEWTADLNTTVLYLPIDAYTPLMWSGFVLSVLGSLLYCFIEGDGDVPVKRFAGMFIQGNALAAMQALIAYQRGGGESRRVSTIERLGQSRSPLNVDELIDGLRDPGFNVRFEAVVSIARTRPDPRLTGALMEALKADEPDMSIAAAWALGRLGDARAVEPLREALDSPYPLLRARAARALGTLGDQPSTERLLERLADEQDTGLKLAYASALGALGDPRALDPLLAMLPATRGGVQRLELALAIAALIGDDQWFVLFARRVQRSAGDAFGGILMSMRRRLLREVEADNASADDVELHLDAAISAFGRAGIDEGARCLRDMIGAIPARLLSADVDIVMRRCAREMAGEDANQLEHLMLCLHSLHLGFGAAPSKA
ncbi:MAG: hypothetical protein CMJ18_27680 [Phycisphaeraceae bacterium]|nr:hypothetical protein [Phycisphaeraceae bacterium]